MKRILFDTVSKKILADVYTPVGIYLRLRDRFRDTILLESADSHAGENSYSIIAIHAIAGIELQAEKGEFKLPGENAEKFSLEKKSDVTTILDNFCSRFQPKEKPQKPVHIAQGLFGYCSYDAVPFFENIELNKNKPVQDDTAIPLLRYRLYQYVIVLNHYKNELWLCENIFQGQESRLPEVESLIRSKDIPVYPFRSNGNEQSNISDEEYLTMVSKGIASCNRGDVFQVVLSRRFSQAYSGDDFNVYRALRSINPGPYMFYFDYGDYKLMGSSPESQLLIENGRAIVHPIAGTFKRTGNDDTDKELALKLEQDPKENAEHVMLVDLARNDLSRFCSGVEVTAFKKIQYYSHVIHMVSKVEGLIGKEKNPFTILGSCFPAGTLSGAPKYRAMQLIDEFENRARGFYGGTIGYMGLDGSCNHAIMIRSFLCCGNHLHYQAGAGVVSASNPGAELREVNNKLSALKLAIELAQNITA